MEIIKVKLEEKEQEFPVDDLKDFLKKGWIVEIGENNYRWSKRHLRSCIRSIRYFNKCVDNYWYHLLCRVFPFIPKWYIRD